MLSSSWCSCGIAAAINALRPYTLNPDVAPAASGEKEFKHKKCVDSFGCQGMQPGSVVSLL